MKEIWYAHGSNKKGSPWEPIQDHILPVSNRAAAAAAVFEAEKEAFIAGIFHDLGKYSELFKQRLEGKEQGLDHWSMGAYAILIKYKLNALAAMLSAQGHHTGLQEGSLEAIHSYFKMENLTNPQKHPQELRITEKNLDLLLHRMEASGITIPSSPSSSLYDVKNLPIPTMLNARMLFSTLVDADFIETEAHFQGTSDAKKIYRSKGITLQAEKAFELVSQHIEILKKHSNADQNVIAMREKLLRSCLEAAGNPSNLFTLTAPTGAGKTLAMLAFALKHALLQPQMRRIIFVVPFLSIIEQTAGIYRRILEPYFGPHYVLEHHSLANICKEKEQGEAFQDDQEAIRSTARLLAENWDAPLVLTTSVQFFNSLFANRPSKCRKLHSLANSIILFDEVQTLPRHLAIPSLAALSHLNERFGCSIIFSTATQPAFDSLHEKIATHAKKGWQPKSIPHNPEHLFKHAKRVHITWKMEKPVSWESIAYELAKRENSKVLCVVNLKRHAHTLLKYLIERTEPESLFHLSTSMCPAHREKTLREVRNRLQKKGSSCRLIATQCVEAGVDVDFPTAWRAFGPLDAIAQVAGRCNREGNMDELGNMVVFIPRQDTDKEYLYPPGGYKTATEITKNLFELKKNDAINKNISFEQVFDIYNPGLFKEYYQLLYCLGGETDFNCKKNDLAEAIQRRSFVDVARLYRLIEQDCINVVVPYQEEKALFSHLKKKLECDGHLTRQWIQEAKPLTISPYRPCPKSMIWNYLEPLSLGKNDGTNNFFMYLNPKDYDPIFGLQPPDSIDSFIN